MLLVALIALSSSPSVEQQVKPPAEAPELGVWAGFSFATDTAPGAHEAVTVGARVRKGHWGFGLEGSLFIPGSDVISDSRAYVGPQFARAGLCFSTPCEFTISGFALTGAATACFRYSFVSACAVGLGGAASVRDAGWYPIVSAGPRIGLEPQLTDSLGAIVSVQVLGSILRPEVGLWKGAPVQLGLTVALQYLR